VITGWLAGDDCPYCGGPLLETSTHPDRLILECPECGYRTAWHTTDPTDDPLAQAGPGELEAE
jgi:endogenous inhibitor of DNA gyrase (YacG/DUF329 family)